LLIYGRVRRLLFLTVKFYCDFIVLGKLNERKLPRLKFNARETFHQQNNSGEDDASVLSVTQTQPPSVSS